MAAMGLGKAVPFGLFNVLEGGMIKEVLDSDLCVSDDLLEVFVLSLLKPVRVKEFLLRFKVEALLSKLESSLFKDRAGLFSFLSSFVVLFTCSFLLCCFSKLDCLVLFSARFLFAAELNVTVGGLICEMWPSFKLKLESERSERAEEKPDDEEVRFDCI